MNFDFSDRLSEFANYLAANTQPQPITSSNLIMPPGDLQPLDASGLINLEPPQQPVIMVNNTGIIFNTQNMTNPTMVSPVKIEYG